MSGRDGDGGSRYGRFQSFSYCIWQQQHLTWLLEPMMERAGLVIEQADYSDDQIFARYICVITIGGNRLPDPKFPGIHLEETGTPVPIRGVPTSTPDDNQ